MAMGKAVVSTTIGAEGLPVTHGETIVIADSPAAFADAVVRLLRDPGERQRLGAAARRLVVERYDWSAVAGDFEAALARACLGSTHASRSETAAPRTRSFSRTAAAGPQVDPSSVS
jgi:glycosyltransferase involved in cell wall biosynthesis